MMELKINVEQRDAETRVVTLEGALNNETCSVFERAVDELLGDAFSKLIIDARRLDYLSSSGLRLFFRLRKGMADRQGSVLMVKPPEAVYKVLRITNAFPEDRMFETLEAAEGV